MRPSFWPCSLEPSAPSVAAAGAALARGAADNHKTTLPNPSPSPQAVIAHELAHVACDHGIWLTMANVLASGTVGLLPVISGGPAPNRHP